MDDAQRKLVGAALQQTRRLMGDSQVELAEVLALSPSMVSWIETGRHGLDMEQLRRLSEHWELPLLTLAERLGYPIDRTAPTFDAWYIQHGSRRATQKAAIARSHNTSASSEINNSAANDVSHRHAHNAPKTIGYRTVKAHSFS